jgi:hypothetical protein
MLPHFKGNPIRMKYTSLFLTSVLLVFTSAHAQSHLGVPKMLREASVYHDEERIRSLIAREVDAEKSRDYVTMKQVIGKLSSAPDLAADGSK